MSWWDSVTTCQGDGSYWDMLLGCGSGVMTQEQQVAAMRGNFGGHADPAMVDKAVSDWDAYLRQTEYTKQLEQAQAIDDANSIWPKMPSLPSFDMTTLGVVAIGLMGLLVFMGDRRPRRYGR